MSALSWASVPTYPLDCSGKCHPFCNGHLAGDARHPRQVFLSLGFLDTSFQLTSKLFHPLSNSSPFSEPSVMFSCSISFPQNTPGSCQQRGCVQPRVWTTSEGVTGPFEPSSVLDTGHTVRMGARSLLDFSREVK